MYINYNTTHQHVQPFEREAPLIRDSGDIRLNSGSQPGLLATDAVSLIIERRLETARRLHQTALLAGYATQVVSAIY